MKIQEEIKRQKAHTICVMKIVETTLKEKFRTQIWLSEQTGIHPSTLSRMKKGSVYISAYQMDLLADIFERPLDWFRPTQKELKKILKQLEDEGV